MPDVLDHAFESLVRDLAHSPGPGAAAAASTARRRRRTRVGAVALAALVVVGGGLTVPRVLDRDAPVTADAAEPLDAAALERATQGWIDGWKVWEPGATARPSYAAADCWSPGRVGGGSREQGSSWFGTDGSDRATLTLQHFASDGAAAAALDEAFGRPGSCGETTMIRVDGLEVRHDAMAPALDGLWLTDVWSVRRGSDLAEIEVATASGPADPEAARHVAEALVAGLRSGDTQTTMATALEDQLTAATDGWTGPWQVPASQSDPSMDALRASCLDLYGPGAGYEKVGAHDLAAPGGAAAYAMFVDYESEGGAHAFAATFVDQVRACGGSHTTARPGGKVVVHGSAREGDQADLWLVVERDRVGMVAVLGADGAAPDSTDAAVTDFLVTAMSQDASYVSPTWSG